jgi:hypothetical protein
MERPFWVAGPVPPARLSTLAIARPGAQAAILDALGEAGTATIGGRRRSGRTTLVHQVAAALRRPFVVVDASALLQGTEEEALQAVRELTRRPAGEADWAAAVRLWHPDAALAVDSCAPGQRAWARGLAAKARVPVLVVEEGEGAGAAVPDAIADETGRSFLERRARTLRMAWTPPALREAVGFAGGRPDVLQRLGAGALHAALEQGRSRVTADDLLEGAVDAAEPPADALAALSPPRASLLKAMVRAPDATPTEWARRCGLDPKAAVVHLQRLESHDALVRKAGRGRYRIASPLLALHIQGLHGTPVRLVLPETPRTAPAPPA